MGNVPQHLISCLTVVVMTDPSLLASLVRFESAQELVTVRLSRRVFLTLSPLEPTKEFAVLAGNVHA